MPMSDVVAVIVMSVPTGAAIVGLAWFRDRLGAGCPGPSGDPDHPSRCVADRHAHPTTTTTR